LLTCELVGDIGKDSPVNSIGRRNTSNLSEQEVGHGDVTDLVHGETEG
jgi:hypothetical protein